ncbi:MAG: Gfo/Idh/MocA family oxidoreductase, partial [Candidatus Brocadiae bacterium]|nr:Gfo/Idh/MocA family oxidoreductase [Candidatus Brocadiia bacterium]
MPYVIARALGKMAGMATRPLGRPSPLRPAHLIACQRRLTYSSQKAQRMLGWRPETGKEEALAATMHSYAARELVSRRADLRLLGRPPKGEPPLTACLVGCGVIAQEHLKVLSRMPNAKVLALCDLNRGAAQELAQRFNVPRTYDDVAAMLDAEQPGVVHILTPPQTHARFAELAARKGCNVLVEKPMAVDAAEARRMADCAAEHGVQLCVDHNHLYDSVVVRARRLVDSGAVGDVIWIESYYGFNLGDNPASRYMLPGGDGHWTFQLPGGLYQNLAPHPLCLALELLGPPRRVHAHARYGRVLPHAPTDELRVLLESEKASGLVTVSLAASPRFQYLNIFGTKMVVFVDLLNKWLIAEHVMRGVPKPVSRAVMNVRRGWTVLRRTCSGMLQVLRKRWTPYEGMDLLIREFYGSLQARRTPPVGAEEGIQVMEVMDEVWRQIGRESLAW